MTDQHQKKSIFAKDDHSKTADNETNEQKEKEKETLAFNTQFFQEISGQTKKRATQSKKAPRVIGVSKKKDKKDKPSRFAKRSTSPVEQKTPSNQVPLFDFSSSISKKEAEEKQENESAFDFSSAAPSNNNESAFDFSSNAAQNNNNESAFDFSTADAPVTPQQGQDQPESAFSFIEDDTPQNQPNNNTQGGVASAFSFVNDDANINVESANQQAPPSKVEDNNNQDQAPQNPQQQQLQQQQQQLSQNESESQDVSQSEKEPESAKGDELLSDVVDELPPAIANRFKSLKIDVDKASKKVSQSRDLLNSANPNDIAARNLYEGNRDKLLNLLDQAIEATKEAPNLLKERESQAKKQIPELQKRKEEATKQLADLDIQQSQDKDQIDKAKKNSEATISSLNRSYDIQYSAFSTKKNQYDQQINKALGPIGDRLAEIEQEKSLEQKQINDLLKKIEMHKQNIAQLDSEYEEKMKIYEETEAKFSSQHDEIVKEEQQLQEQRKKVDLKIKQIEAPYQSLLDAVEKREKKMKIIAKTTDKIDGMLADCKRDISQCSSAAEIVTKLCNQHESVVKNRIQTKSKVEEIKSRLNQLSQLSKPNDDQIQVLKIKSARAADVVSASTERISQLEIEKKTAISQKNFMGAKQITQQLKDLQDQLAAAQKTVTESDAQISKIEKDNSQQHDQIKIAKEELEEAKYTLLENDFNYFESTIAVLDGLFELSPFGSKLLKPLQEIVLRGLSDIERPPELDPNIINLKIEELNKKLDEAVKKEDFEAADEIQEKINKLNAKISH